MAVVQVKLKLISIIVSYVVLVWLSSSTINIYKVSEEFQT